MFWSNESEALESEQTNRDQTNSAPADWLGTCTCWHPRQTAGGRPLLLLAWGLIFFGSSKKSNDAHDTSIDSEAKSGSVGEINFTSAPFNYLKFTADWKLYDPDCRGAVPGAPVAAPPSGGH